MIISEIPLAAKLPTLDDELNNNIPQIVSQSVVDSSKEYIDFKIELIIAGFSESDATKLSTVLKEIVVLQDGEKTATFVLDDDGKLLAFIPKVTSGIRGGERKKPITLGRLGANQGNIHYPVKSEFQVTIPPQTIPAVQNAALKYYNQTFKTSYKLPKLKFVPTINGYHYD